MHSLSARRSFCSPSLAKDERRATARITCGHANKKFCIQMKSINKSDKLAIYVTAFCSVFASCWSQFPGPRPPGRTKRGRQGQDAGSARCNCTCKSIDEQRLWQNGWGGLAAGLGEGQTGIMAGKTTNKRTACLPSQINWH